MKDSGQPTNVPAQSVKPNELATVSERKLKANRENAKKSTGPKTPRGKAYSRMNARKHGLFIGSIAELMSKEDLKEFDRIHKDLVDERQPVGPTQEYIVEHIATCWLRVRCLPRYEIAEQQSTMTLVDGAAQDGSYFELANSHTLSGQLSLLQRAEQEVETTGRISPWSMKEIFENWQLRTFWPYYEADAERTTKRKRQELTMSIAENRKIPVSEAKRLLVRDPKSLAEYTRFVTLETLRAAIRQLSEQGWKISHRYTQLEYLRQLIPQQNALDRIIRYGNTFERQLLRAYEWLEREQRRRKGEPVLPPVSVRLTQ
jgi:hypothetical protein